MLESLYVLENSTVNIKPATNTRVHIAFSNACALCNEDHFLQICDLFRGKTPADLEAFVRHKEPFLNCLGYHKSPMCRSDNKCHKCNDKTQYVIARSFCIGCCYRGVEQVHRISCCVNTKSYANVATLRCEKQ